MSENVSFIQKKLIKSLLYGNYDIIRIIFARVYTFGNDSKFWLYSGLEGALVYCIEVRIKVAKFLLINLKSFEIVFDCELYKKFYNNFIKENDNFFYFEVNKGFIGLEIPNKEEANSLEEDIQVLTDDYIKSKLRSYRPMKESEIKEKGRKNIEILKKVLNIAERKPIQKEIILNQGELERSINTIKIDEKNGKLIVDRNEYNIGRIIMKGKQVEEKGNNLDKKFENEKIKENNNKVYGDLNNKIYQNKEENNNIKLNKDNKDGDNNNKNIKDIKDIKDNNNKEVLQTNQNCKESNDTKIRLIFESVDQKIKETILCQSNERFHILEGLLYEKYPQYKESENYFIVNGVKVNRFKTLKENSIKNGDKIILNIIDYDD